MPANPTNPPKARLLAAGDRLCLLQEGEKGGRTIVHRWVYENFTHTTDEICVCCPTVVAGDDPRSLDEIMDDLHEAERGGVVGH